MTVAALRARWDALNPSSRGLAWYMTDQMAVVVIFVLIKMVGATYPVFQVVTIRLAMGLVLLLPVILTLRVSGLRTRRVREHLWRNLCSTVGITCSYYALTQLPLADATVLGFVGPMAMTVVAAVVLKEKVGWRRGTAVLVGFAGVLLIVQPSAGIPTDAIAISIFGTVVTCLGVATAKRLLEHESAAQVTVWYTVMSFVMSLPAAIATWTEPRLADWPLFLAIGVLSTLGHYCFLRAYREADAGFLAGFGYLRLLLAIVLGYLVFTEVPGPWTLAGAAVILSAALYIGLREAQLRRRAAGAFPGPSRGGAPR